MPVEMALERRAPDLHGNGPVRPPYNGAGNSLTGFEWRKRVGALKDQKLHSQR